MTWKQAIGKAVGGAGVLASTAMAENELIDKVDDDASPIVPRVSSKKEPLCPVVFQNEGDHSDSPFDGYMEKGDASVDETVDECGDGLEEDLGYIEDALIGGKDIENVTETLKGVLFQILVVSPDVATLSAPLNSLEPTPQKSGPVVFTEVAALSAPLNSSESTPQKDASPHEDKDSIFQGNGSNFHVAESPKNPSSRGERKSPKNSPSNPKRALQTIQIRKMERKRAKDDKFFHSRYGTKNEIKHALRSSKNIN